MNKIEGDDSWTLKTRLGCFLPSYLCISCSLCCYMYMWISVKYNLEVNYGLSNSQVSFHRPRQVEELGHYELEDFVDIYVVGCAWEEKRCFHSSCISPCLHFHKRQKNRWNKFGRSCISKQLYIVTYINKLIKYQCCTIIRKNYLFSLF